MIYIFLAIVVGCGLYLWANWKFIKRVAQGNCLVFRHPDNNPQGLPTVEICKVDNPPGPGYPFHPVFFLPKKIVRWCYEVKVKEEYKLVPFIPDDNADYKGQTTGQLATALDWRPAKRIFRQKAKLMEKLAMGSIVLLGCASLFGLFMLLEMVNKPV